MKLMVPQLDLDQQKGFAADIDIFKRKDFGERLATLIENADDHPVIALNSGWGEGKSTFIKMWQGYLEHERPTKLKTVYFDAFKNDYQKDPFLALAAEIYNLLDCKDSKRKAEFKKMAASAAKSLMRGAIKIGIKAATAGLVDGTEAEDAVRDFSALLSEQVDEIIAEKLKNVEKDRLALDTFREYLAEITHEIGKGKPVIFIIDELDRCRPDFALELLEQIKHLFSVKGLTFLLITNRTQLEESIRSKYGSGVNATNYLHKFINLWMSLPKKTINTRDYREVFIDYALHKMMNDQEKILLTESLDVIKDLAVFHTLSLREIERMLAYFAIIQNLTASKNYNENYQNLIAIICFIAANKPELLLNLESLDHQELFNELGLNHIDEKSKYNSLYNLKIYIKFDLADEKTKDLMIENREIRMPGFRRYTEGDLKIIAGWLSEISTGY